MLASRPGAEVVALEGVVAATLEVMTAVNLVMWCGEEPPVSGLCLGQLQFTGVFFSTVGGGDQGYGSGRYDSRPGGYGYGYGRSRDYGGRWVAKGLGCSGGAAFLSLRAGLPGYVCLSYLGVTSVCFTNHDGTVKQI